MTIEQLSEMCITEAMTVNQYKGLVELSLERYEQLRAMIVDAAVTKEQQEGKRSMLENIRAQQASLEAIVSLMDRDPMSTEEFRDELEATLLRGFVTGGVVIGAGDAASYSRERSNAIAANYAGRVAREPVTK